MALRKAACNMRIAVTAQGEDLDSAVDPRFGRCRSFIIVDPESDGFEVFSNEGVMASGGAGTQSAQFLADKGVDAVITGNVGPNAARALEAAGIKIVQIENFVDESLLVHLPVSREQLEIPVFDEMPSVDLETPTDWILTPRDFDEFRREVQQYQ